MEYVFFILIDVFFFLYVYSNFYVLVHNFFGLPDFYFTFIIIIILGYVCMHILMYTHDTVNLWTSEDNLEELILSFYHVCSEDQIKVIRLGSKNLY